MDDLRIEWDEAKSEANRRKHGIDFEEASTVFADEHALLIDDPDHSEEEDRFILLGLSAILRLLVVCHCYRTDDSIIRIISARKATKSEQADYSREQ
ncbi:MAG: BrnT family toxin [Planctomycetes bacterium]|nr:BrnT family toxin [Planctomycetota bacterium]